MPVRPTAHVVGELRTLFRPVEMVAVNRCSGNRRRFFNPRVTGGQLANYAMDWHATPGRAGPRQAGHRVPDNDGACVETGTTAAATRPIRREGVTLKIYRATKPPVDDRCLGRRQAAYADAAAPVNAGPHDAGDLTGRVFR
jgi:hypothetical protein